MPPAAVGSVLNPTSTTTRPIPGTSATGDTGSGGVGGVTTAGWNVSVMTFPSGLVPPKPPCPNPPCPNPVEVPAAVAPSAVVTEAALFGDSAAAPVRVVAVTGPAHADLYRVA